MGHLAYTLKPEELRMLSLGEVLGFISDWERDLLTVPIMIQTIGGFLERRWTKEGYKGWKRKFENNPYGFIRAGINEIYQIIQEGTPSQRKAA